ncbi:hypothetical protein GCM10020000_09050 [Streptomyces olivoverticillatus]
MGTGDGAGVDQVSRQFGVVSPVRRRLIKSTMASLIMASEIVHLGTLDFVAGKENVIFLGPKIIRG